ncbi:molybdopterin dinucleotide binding domain-containing protein [Actinomycetospora sp. TBRC 11914]|uniref:molybdopterin dinucleotide binding domain-containing protein n=1 Tax=Actinomycetospora sp. TBRC 11914 TaxID=2729387 RepID=UPI00289C69C3|nr:molybdopterin dinucleotide binding domain-containing protein [Actinomycetospora sp. TBRC 11914]
MVHRDVRRICPLCEATCGLLVDLDKDGPVALRPNPDDVFSAGHACAKGLGLAATDRDPDRLRTPMVREGGRLRAATWAEAFAAVARRLPPLVAQDRRAAAVYTGNPAAHHLDHTFYLPAFLGALGTPNLFSPASLDTLPKNLATMLLYGTGLGVALPDLDRTDLVLLLGTNPLVSNGSTVCMPGFGDRLAALRARGGRVVVADPARTRTAEVADLHLPVRPNSDAHLLLGMLSVIAADGSACLGAADGLVDGADEVLGLAAPFTPEVVAPVVGIPPETIRDLARSFAAAERAVAHARIGTCTQGYGSLANWLVEVLNIVTGRLDTPGGAMFAKPPGGGPTTWPGGGKLLTGRWHSRVRGLPESLGELPAACLAEEILTPGEGQVRALVTIAGNPARSVPGSEHVEEALASLDFMLSLDTYLNETTRHADVVLPAPGLLTHGHFDLTLNHFQIRDAARWSPAALDPAPGELPEWHQLARLTGILRGDPDLTVTAFDDEVADQAIRRAAKLARRPEDVVRAAVEPRRGPERLLDLRLRSGPYGDRFGEDPSGLTLAVLEEHPDGIDYGPLRPRLPDVLRTPTGRIDVAPEVLMADVERLRAGLEADAAPDRLVMINRRQRRGMNSWLHNALPHRTDAESALLMHPDDAASRDLVDGDEVVVRSGAGQVTAELRVDDAIRPGVVSLPHGWGHDGGGLRMRRATASPGTNVNALADDLVVEPLTGIAIFSGITVEVEAHDHATVPAAAR